MSYLSIQNLGKSFGSFRAVDDLRLDVEKGEVCALLGPSGCGKTTTLRCIAGLEKADSGTIRLDGRELFDSKTGLTVPPEARDIGMVFQSYALWPHKSIGQNVALGLKIKGLSKPEIRDRVAAGLELVGMGGAEDRFPANLSGGQQQRVALARALALQPKCILFDEPLSNLDLLLRERMRFEIRDLLVRLGITAVYVTHDQTEAMVISDHVVVMNQGKIERQGPPAKVYLDPQTRFTAEFLGRTNILALDAEASDLAQARAVASNGLSFETSGTNGAAIAPGRKVIAFRPELVQIGEAAGTHNRFDTTVLSSQFLGANTQLMLDLAGVPVAAVLAGEQARQPGDKVPLSIRPEHVLILSDG